VRAFGDRLLATSGECLNDDGRDYLSRMQDAAGRMSVLIGDLLSYSRVTTQAQPFVPVSLSNLAHEALSNLEVAVEQAGATVDIGQLPQIEADASQVRQLFQNLLANALKFRRPDVAPVVLVRGRLLNTTYYDPDDPAPPDCCEVTVQDNGVGFEEKFRERIFGVFQRLHTRDEYPGTGIGLALCRKIVERHGGAIGAEGRPGEGATFTVTLPVRHPAEEPIHGPENSANHVAGS